jgi:DNA-binding CsgD family transcriptional regulator
MPRMIPIQVFEKSHLPVLAVDTAGTILYGNRATADLLASTGDLVQGRPCWKVTRFRAAEGGAFCCRDCPIRRRARRGSVPALEHVMLPAGPVAPRRFDLLNFLLPPSPGTGCLVLHFILPVSDDAARRRAVARPRDWPAADRLHLLSPRELEVLEGLAGGLDAADVAGQLAISLSTARNHIRSILRKLDLHRQVDAVLLFLGGTGAPAARLVPPGRTAS